ncbi:MAG: LamG-like jellyroll fold domain-containing protein [Lentisphaeria bacterium]
MVNREKSINIYVDGKLVCTQAKSKAYNVNGENILRIGAKKTAVARFFKGKMNEV